MKISQGLDTSKNWFRGNLHTHTTISDGKCSPEEVISRYKNNGWHFMAITDHQIYGRHDEFSSENFLLLPGIELEASQENPLRIYHILGISGNSPQNGGIATKHKVPIPHWEGLKTAQQALDYLNQTGNISVFCHPNWSRLEIEDFIGLQDYTAIEVFNYGCEVENHTGLSSHHWDSLLRRGKKVWAIATDDSHQRDKDWCGGWIEVNCESLTVECVSNAIKTGNFYSSSGPQISRYNVEDGFIHVECSPCNAVHFVAFERWGQSFYAQNEQLLTHASYKLTGKEDYVRVECVDVAGKTAWGNPIFLKI